MTGACSAEKTLKAEIIVGMLYQIDGNRLVVARDGDYDFVAPCDGPAVEDPDWVLGILGKWVRCKVIDDVIREVEVYG